MVSSIKVLLLKMEVHAGLGDTLTSSFTVMSDQTLSMKVKKMRGPNWVKVTEPTKHVGASKLSATVGARGEAWSMIDDNSPDIQEPDLES